LILGSRAPSVGHGWARSRNGRFCGHGIGCWRPCARRRGEQGRYLGGRPPYGYRLVDAGPHPNRTHAGWGRRLRRLDPDPVTAPHVQWMFAQPLAGRSVASIARELTETGVPFPSDADPERNGHRTGGMWPLRTVAVILANPRYTGRQVWDRQRTERDSGSTSQRCAATRDSGLERGTPAPGRCSCD
jgi:site-specific DNA recombinase